MIRTNRIWIRQPPRKMKEKNKDKDKAVWEWDLNKVWLLALLLKCNMKKNQLFEGMDFHDLEEVVEPVLTVDDFSASMGKDCDIVTLSVVVKSKQAGKDLSEWFERGYEWILDAEVSEGELSSGRYVVF